MYTCLKEDEKDYIQSTYPFQPENELFWKSEKEVALSLPYYAENFTINHNT